MKAICAKAICATVLVASPLACAASASAIPNPVVTKAEAAFATNTVAASWCGRVRRGSQTHKCTYPSLAATKGTCATTILKSRPFWAWLVRCDMRYWVTEKWGRYIYIFGCRMLVDKSRPIWQISARCEDGPPRLIKKARM